MNLFNARLYAFMASNTASSFAEPCIRFGVSWYVLQTTGSAALFALLFGISVFVDAYSRPLLSPLADYFDRLRVYRVATSVAIIVSAALFLAVALAPFSPWLLGALLVSMGFVSGLREPTSSALVAQLARPQDMVRVQSIQSFMNSAISTAGPAMAGALVALIGPKAALAGASCFEAVALLGSFCVQRAATSSVAASSVAVPSSAEASVTEAAGTAPSWAVYRSTVGRRILDGLACLWKTEAERKVIIASMFINTGLVVFLSVVLPVWVSRELGGTSALMALLESSFGIGLLVGSSVFIAVMSRYLNRARLVVLGPLLAAAALTAAAFITYAPAVVVLVAMVGASLPLYTINSGTVRALATPDHYRARLMGAAGFVVHALIPIVLPVFALLLSHFSSTASVVACAGLMCVGAFLLARNKVSQRLLKLPNDQVVGQYPVLYPGAFPDRSQAAAAAS